MAEMGRFIKPILSVVAARPGKISRASGCRSRRLAKAFKDLPRRAADHVHPADDDERRRLPGSVVRDRAAEGDDERESGSSAPSKARVRRAPRTCCSTTTWARSTAPSGPGACRGRHGRDRYAIANAALSLGAEIRTEAPVAQSRRAGGAATGVVLESGEEIEAGVVTVLPRLAPDVHQAAGARLLDPSFREEVLRYKYRGSSGKVNLALDGLPELACKPGGASGSAARSASRRRSTTSSARTTMRSTAAVQPRPYIDCIMPTLVDPVDGASRQARHELLRAVRALSPRRRRGVGRRRARGLRPERDRHARGALPDIRNQIVGTSS